jgi:2-dehydro-3-deoxygalactonokinase
MTFVAIDWGSSRFRAYRVERGGVTDRIVSGRGVQSTLATEPDALAATLVSELTPWRGWIEGDHVPVLMAGMIGSNRGLRDAGYQRLPIRLDALARANVQVEVATPLATKVSIRPGLAIAEAETYDVMRGEEVQLLGAFLIQPANLYVFPGTHSKWVPIEDASGDARVPTFSTMMTGELYAWLVEGSLVCRGLPATTPWDDDAFLRGMERSAQGGDIIEEMFRTRARWLLGDIEPKVTPSYLSGLLIGHEVVAMTRRYPPGGALVIVGAERLCALYERAARQLAIAATVIVDEAAMVAGFGRLHDGG